MAVALVGAGLPVYRLASGQRDLEAVFREVNEGEFSARRARAEQAAAAEEAAHAV